MRGNIKVEASHVFTNSLFITVSVDDRFIDSKQFIRNDHEDTMYEWK